MRIGIVAAEPSGDTLAAGLMQAIKSSHPEVVFEGIGGPRMLGQGMQSWFPMEKLSVMGLVEVLKHLPGLLAVRRNLLKRWRQAPPDLFIGVDAPDFNLGLETKLRSQGVATVHYVCPSVWAWRPKRVKKIRAAADLVLSIFPFEKDFLSPHGIMARYVGHPLAQAFPLPADKPSARAELSLTAEQPVLALLPGSRASEIQYLSRPFLLTAAACSRQLPGLRVLVPLVNDKTAKLFQAQLTEYAPGLDVTILDANARLALTAADAALIASGTATFEGLLCECPMVVGYKLHWLSYRLIMGMKLLQIEHVSMANLLSGEALAPEFIQRACEPEQLIPAVTKLLQQPQQAEPIRQHYREIHQSLIMNTNQRAADAVMSLLAGAGHG